VDEIIDMIEKQISSKSVSQ